MTSPTLPEIIGMALGIGFIAFATFTALQVLKSLLISFGHDIRAWWRSRKPHPSWQPHRYPWQRTAIRKK